ncbi:transposase, partial [Streptomyces sp. NPDC048340]|uniref:transposase n=1 Tax=Streptomyces sp. NPDC048340 TaxID=3365537 RepID=UPI003722084B
QQARPAHTRRPNDPDTAIERSTCLDHIDRLRSNHSASRRTWKKIQSTNPLERLNREIKRRSDVVQVFPNTAAVTRLATAVLVELHDEWIAFPRRYLSIESMDSLYPDTNACLPGKPD